MLNSGEAYVHASVLPARPFSHDTAPEKNALRILQEGADAFGTRYNQCHKNLTLPGDGMGLLFST